MKVYITLGIACIVALMALVGYLRRKWVQRQARYKKQRQEAELYDALFEAPEKAAKAERERLKTLDNTGLANELNKRRRQ